MKDYRLCIGMRFEQRGREFVIEGPVLRQNFIPLQDTSP
jgi:hypothetical protein